jgi:hypothetical protein
MINRRTNTTFNREEWLAFDQVGPRKTRRDLMLYDLVRKYPIIGLSRNELYKLLGLPLSNFKFPVKFAPEDSWYHCGSSLYIQFHFENELVSAYRLCLFKGRLPPPAGPKTIWFKQNIGLNEDYPLDDEGKGGRQFSPPKE